MNNRSGMNRRAGMLTRIGWIAVSYLTRPLVLALFGLGLLFLVLGMLPPLIRPNTWWAFPGTPTARLMIDSQAKLDEVRASGRQAEVDGMDLNKLWIDPARGKYTGPPDAAFYQVVEEFPNLRILFFNFEENKPTGIDQIVKLKNLEYLSLNGFGLYDFAPLASLRNLRRLDLILMASAKHDDGKWFMPEMKGLDALASMPMLDTLLLHRRALVNDTMFSAAAKFPHLSTLALYQEYAYPRMPITPEIDKLSEPKPPTKVGFDALAAARALRVVYVGGDANGPLIGQIRQSAPRFWVFPDSRATVFFMLMRAPFILLLPSFCFALAIGAQLSSQFLGPGSRVMPRFVATHALVASLLAVGAIALGVARLLAIDLTLPAAVAVSTALVTAELMMASPSASKWVVGRRMKGIEHLTYLIPVVVIFSLNPPAFGIRLNSPYAIAAYSLAACVSLAMIVWSLGRLGQWTVDSSSASRRSLTRPELLTAGTGGRWLYATKRRERQIENILPATAHSTWWQRVQRWRLGNPAFRSLAFAIVGLGIQIPFAIKLSRLGGLDHSELAFAGCILLIMLLAQAAMIWRQRLLVLPLESLRPISRSDMQRELAVAFALDLVPLAIVFAVFETLTFHLGEILNHDWRSVPLDFLIFLALGTAWALAAGALLVVLRRPWIAITLLPLLALANAGTVLAIAEFSPAARQWLPSILSPEQAQTQLWLPIVTGMILCWLLWRRWLRLEIGDRTSLVV